MYIINNHNYHRGTYWGMNNYFYLARGIDNLGIESNDCVWAVWDGKM